MLHSCLRTGAAAAAAAAALLVTLVCLQSLSALPSMAYAASVHGVPTKPSSVACPSTSFLQAPRQHQHAQDN
jgi:hypothetical protein